MKESKLKGRLTLFTFASKIILVLYILFEYSVDAFELKEIVSLIGIILPLFAVYITTMLKDAGKHRYRSKSETASTEDPIVKKSYVKISMIMFIMYPLAMIFVIYSAAENNSLALAQAGLAIVETALGVYIAQIVMDLFQANPKN